MLWRFALRQVRNDLTSAEFALNLNAFRIDPGWSADERAAAAGVVDGVANGGRGGGGDTMSKIDYDRIAERLEAILRTLKAGRPLSLLETISQEEVRSSGHLHRSGYVQDLELMRRGLPVRGTWSSF